MAGSGGHIVSSILNEVFAGITTPGNPLTLNGTWHVLPETDGKFHFKPRHRSCPIEKQIQWYGKESPDTTVISISCSTTIELSLLVFNWFRISDEFPFTPIDLLPLSNDEFVSKYRTINESVNNEIKEKNSNLYVDELLDFRMQRQNEVEHQILRYVYQGNNTIKEIDLICNWPYYDKFQFMLHTEIPNNNAYVDSIKNDNSVQLLFFSMLSLFDNKLAINEINRISEVLKLPKLIDNDVIINRLNFFRSNLRGLPNIELVQQKLNAIVCSESVTLTDLNLHDKILLVIAVRIQFNLRFSPIMFSYPKSTVAFRSLINNMI